MLFTNSAGRLQKFSLMNHAVRLLPAIPRQISTHDGIPVRRGGKRSWLPNSAFCNLRCLLINLDSFQRRERPALVHLSPCESESECWPNCHFSAQFSVKTVTQFNLIHVSSAHCHTLKVKVYRQTSCQQKATRCSAHQNLFFFFLFRSVYWIQQVGMFRYIFLLWFHWLSPSVEHNFISPFLLPIYLVKGNKGKNYIPYENPSKSLLVVPH